MRLLLAGLLLVSSAAAELTVEAPPGPHQIVPGEAGIVTFDVTFSEEGFACFQGDQFTVSFTSHDTGLASMPNMEIPAITFDPGQGVFLPPVGQPYTETQSVSVELQVLDNAPADHTHAYRYTADFSGGTTCFGTNQPAAATVDFGWEIYTGPAPEPEPETTVDDPVPPETESTPAPFGLALLAMAAIASRRP